MEGLNPDAGLRVRFFDHSVRNRFKSEKAGHDVYETRVYIEIINPSNLKSIPVRPAVFESTRDIENKIVIASDVDRFPRQYEAYKNKKEDISGLLIRVWAMRPDDTLVQVLEQNSIRTVEELACYQKDELRGFPNFYVYKQKAIKYFKSQQDNAELSKVINENSSMKEEIELLKIQMKEISEASMKMIEEAKKTSDKTANIPLSKDNLKKKTEDIQKDD